MKLIVFLSLIFLDFLSKTLVFNFVKLNNIIPIAFFIDITHIHNYGIAFGLFSSTFSPWFIILTGVVMIIFLIFWMLQVSNIVEKWGFLLIIAGAIANIGDRLINNYVLDFIFLHYKEYYWPAFNFADVYISVGLLIIVIVSIKFFNNSLKEKNV